MGAGAFVWGGGIWDETLGLQFAWGWALIFFVSGPVFGGLGSRTFLVSLERGLALGGVNGRNQGRRDIGDESDVRDSCFRVFLLRFQCLLRRDFPFGLGC